MSLFRGLKDKSFETVKEVVSLSKKLALIGEVLENISDEEVRDSIIWEVAQELEVPVEKAKEIVDLFVEKVVFDHVITEI